MKKVIFAIGILLCLLTSIEASDYYVAAVNGSNTTGDGTQAKPWKSITYALSRVTIGAELHTIHVAAAVYDTTLETFPIMIKNKVSLVGSGREVTIIDAQGKYTVIVCENITDSRTRIEGFTVTGGLSPSGQGVIRIQAGGINLEASSPTIANNRIVANVGEGRCAAGIACLSGSSPIIESNVIANNTGKSGNSVHGIEAGSGIIRNNIIENHREAGIASWSGSLLIEGNVIRLNAYGIECEHGATAIIEANTISDNDYGIHLGYVNVKIEKNIIAHNVKNGVFLWSADIGKGPGPTIISNTIDENGSDGICLSSNYGKVDISLVKNNIISNNTGYGMRETGLEAEMKSVQFNLFHNNKKGHYLDKGTQTYTSVALMDSLIQECRWNLEGSPLFVDAANGNYNLLPGSPAINAGAPNSSLDPDGSRADIGALPFFDTSGVPKIPKNLRAISGNAQVALAWSANIEPDLAYYTIYRNKTNGFVPSPADSIARVNAPDTTYLNSGLTNSITYNYRICAVDSTWKKSDFTAEVSATPHEVATSHYYVDDSGVNAPERGAQSSPWKTVTYALSRISVTGGDYAAVHVSPGTYSRALGEIFPISVKNKVSLIGAGAAMTILDAGGTGSVLKCVAISDSATHVEGFTIRNGSNSSGGGAIFITAGSTLSIANNIITANKVPVNYLSTTPKSELGGGIYILNSTPKILNNTISDNWVGAVDLFSTGSGGWGGAIAIYGGDSAPLIKGNTITGNKAINTSFASGFGGGIYIGDGASPTIVKNIISGNSLQQLSATSGPTRGGGIYLGGQATAIIANDSIANNTASAMYGSVKACAGIFLDSTFASITNNVITRNDFGGIHLSLSSPKIVNNTIVDNKQDGIYLSNVSIPTIINNILAFNTRDGIHEDSYGDDPDWVAYNLFHANESSLYLDEGSKKYYNTQSLHNEVPECSNNIEGDPLFVDAANGDYHFLASSPAKNAGHPDAKYNDPDGSRSDIGAFGGPGAIPTSVGENPKKLATVPESYALTQNFPNPFNPETGITYQLPQASDVSLCIYNLLGQLVITLIDEKQVAGYYTVRWNGMDKQGQQVRSGVYLYSFKARDFMQIRKMILVR